MQKKFNRFIPSHTCHVFRHWCCPGDAVGFVFRHQRAAAFESEQCHTVLETFPFSLIWIVWFVCLGFFFRFQSEQISIWATVSKPLWTRRATSSKRPLKVSAWTSSSTRRWARKCASSRKSAPTLWCSWDSRRDSSSIRLFTLICLRTCHEIDDWNLFIRWPITCRTEATAPPMSRAARPPSSTAGPKRCALAPPRPK